jgi:hypothetical protein
VSGLCGRFRSGFVCLKFSAIGVVIPGTNRWRGFFALACLQRGLDREHAIVKQVFVNVAAAMRELSRLSQHL